MANSKDGQALKDKYKDLATRNAHVQYESSNIYYFVMNNVYSSLNMSNIKVKRFITKRNIYVKYENSGTHCPKVISKVQVFKK